MSIALLGAAGMANAAQRFEKAADKILRGGGDADGMVGMIEAKTQFRASAALVRVSDAMLADLLSIQQER